MATAWHATPAPLNTNSQIETVNSRRPQPDLDLATCGLRKTEQGFRAWQRLAAFQASNGGLAGSHPDCQLRLGQSGALAGFNQFGRNLEFRSQGIVFRPDFRIGQQAGLEFVKWDSHSTSFARRSASSISARGVRCVFFTNARTTTTLLPTAVM